MYHTKKYREAYQKKCRTLTRVEAAYLAGLIDGEGCILARAHKQYNGSINVHTSLAVTMCHKPTIYSLKKVTGFGHIDKQNRLTKGHRRPYRWTINSAISMASLLTQLLPYMITKKKEARLLLRVARLRAKKKFYGGKIGCGGTDVEAQLELTKQIIAEKRRTWL